MLLLDYIALARGLPPARGLVGWLVGWLAGWLAGCLVAWLLGYLVTWLLGCWQFRALQANKNLKNGRISGASEALAAIPLWQFAIRARITAIVRMTRLDLQTSPSLAQRSFKLQV